MRDEKINDLFTTHSFVVEAALVRIAALIEGVKGVEDTTIFFELAADRASSVLGALTDGATLARFISKNIVTLRKLTRRTWDEWNVPSRPKYHSYGGGLTKSAATQMGSVVDAMRDALRSYSDEEFAWIEKVDSSFANLIATAKTKDSDFVAAIRNKVSYMAQLIEKLFGYNVISSLVSEAADADWTDVMIARIHNEPEYVAKYVVNDDEKVDAGNAQWRDVSANPSAYVFGKFRFGYFEKGNGKYFDLLNDQGELYHFLLNFIMLHTGITLICDDLSVQRVNKKMRDVVFAIRKPNNGELINPYTENDFKENFFAKHVEHDAFAGDFSLMKEARSTETDIYEFDEDLAAMKGSKEICYALEWLCLQDVTDFGIYAQLAWAYINAKWEPLAHVLIVHAYNNSFVKGGVHKCGMYEYYFKDFLKGAQRPAYLKANDFMDRLSTTLHDTRKVQMRMLRVPESVWQKH